MTDGRLRALIDARVRVRFSLGADAFAARVQDIARRQAASGSDLVAVADRLSLDDLYLASACAEGDEAAWAECVGTYRDFVRRFAQRVLREPDATDVADAVIADLWQRRKIARYEGRSSLRTWLATVVSHASLNAAKESKPRGVAADAPGGDLETTIDEAARARTLAQLLAESIAGQPVDDQLLIFLYYEQGSTLDELAPVLGLSKAALSRRLKRIRATLLDSADALARRRVGASVRSLAGGLDWSAVDLDLRAACRLAVEQRPAKRV